MSTLPAESITTSEDRASAVRAATTDVAAPTASAAFSNNRRRLTSRSPSLLGSLDIAHPRVDRRFRIVKIAHRSSRSIESACTPQAAFGQVAEYLTDKVPTFS